MTYKKKQLIMTLLTAFVLILFGCHSVNKEDSAIDTESELDHEVESKEEPNDLGTISDGSDNNQSEKQNEIVEQTDGNTTTEAKEDLRITSGEEAVQFLKEQLEEGKDEDISFGTDGILMTDEKGAFYTIQLVDVPIRISGKTGNLGYYKVYQDGTYEPVGVSSVSDGNETNSVKEYYLMKLNEIEREMENSQKNAQTTTTLDLEKEEEQRYQTWDAALNEIYGVLKEQLSTEEMEQLRGEQRNWITYRDETAKQASSKYEGGSMETLEYVATQTKLTKERCYELVENYMN